jgi:anti-sigma B factor antagonist
VPQLSPGPSDSSFAVDREVRGTTQILSVRGDLDIAACQALTAVIDRAIGFLPDRVVIDLSAVTFMDSAGVHCLVRAQGHAKARHVDLVVIPGSGPAQRALSLRHVDQPLPLRPSSEPQTSTAEQLQRKVAAARQAAMYLTGEAQHDTSLSQTLLHADRRMRERLQFDPPHNTTPAA